MQKELKYINKTYKFKSSVHFPDEVMATRVSALIFADKGNRACKTVNKTIYAFAAQCALIRRKKRRLTSFVPKLKQFKTDINGNPLF